MAYTKETRVHVATGEESIARACRSLSVGQFMVQRFWNVSWANGDVTRGYFNTVSSHHSLEAAEKALKKLNRKIAKEMQ